MTNNVPFLDLKAQYASISDDIDAAIQSVVASQHFIGGPMITTFEAEFAGATGSRHAIGVSNGTAAISLALEAAGIGVGDEVVVPAMTFAATAEAVCHVGATPVFADVDASHFTLDPSSVEDVLGPRTRAVIPVHLYGNPCDMDQLVAVADEHELLIIEDCAQAHLASYRGRPVGSFGIAATYSFYPGKNLGAYGDAGAVTTDSEAMADRIRQLRDHGRSEKHTHSAVGYNHRIDTIQAAILSAKLPYLRSWTADRIDVARQYRALLQDSDVTVMQQMEEADAVYHLFPVLVEQRRDETIASLRRVGIGVGMHYPIPLHQQPAFGEMSQQRTDLSVSERIGTNEISLPIYPELLPNQIERVVDALESATAEGRT